MSIPMNIPVSTDNLVPTVSEPSSGSRTVPLSRPPATTVPTIVPTQPDPLPSDNPPFNAQPSSTVKYTSIHTNPTMDTKELFLRDFHGRTYIRRITAAIVLLVINSWFLGQYNEQDLLIPVVLVLFVLNIVFFTFQVLFESWLIVTSCARLRQDAVRTKNPRGTSSTTEPNPFIPITGRGSGTSSGKAMITPPTASTGSSTGPTPSVGNNTKNNDPSASHGLTRIPTLSVISMKNLFPVRLWSSPSGFPFLHFQPPLLDLQPYWFIAHGYLDLLWLFQIVYATIAHQVSLIALCDDPVRSVFLRQCQGWKLSFIPVSPFLVCWGATSLILLLSTVPLYNFVAMTIVFGLTTALWIVLFRPVPEPLTAFDPATNPFTTNIFPPGSEFTDVQSRSNAFAIVLFIAVWILMTVLAVIIPRVYRMNYSLRLLHQEQLVLYKESTRKKEKATRKAVYARILAIRATTASIVADATIGYTFHALKNPLHVLTILMDEWTDTYYKGFFLPPSGTGVAPTTTSTTTTVAEPSFITSTPSRGPSVEPSTESLQASSSSLTPPPTPSPFLSTTTVNKYIPISIEDLDMFAEALSRLQHTTEEAGIHNSLLGRRIKYNPETIYLPEYLSLILRESLRSWEKELYIGHHHRFITTTTLPLYTIPFYTIDPRIYTYVILDRLRIRDILRNAFANAYEASFDLLPLFLPNVLQESLKYDTETNRQRYLRQQSIHFFIRSLQDYPAFLDQLLHHNLAPYPVSLQLSLVSRPYLHANEIFASPTAVIADGNRGRYYTPQPLPYPLPDNYFTSAPKSRKPAMVTPSTTATKPPTTTTTTTVIPPPQVSNVSDAEKGQITEPSVPSSGGTTTPSPRDEELRNETESVPEQLITPSTGLVSIFSPDQGSPTRRTASTVRTLHPFLRFEIINIGYGLPAGETARSLFAPFLAFRSRSSDQSNEEIRESVTQVHNSHVPHPNPHPPLTSTVPEHTTNGPPPGNLTTTTEPPPPPTLRVPLPPARFTTDQQLPPPSPSEGPLDLPRAEEEQINEIYRMLQREKHRDKEDKRDSLQKPKRGEASAHVPVPPPVVPAEPSRPTSSSQVSPTDKEIPRTSSSSSGTPSTTSSYHERESSPNLRDILIHGRSTGGEGMVGVGGLHWHTRNTGLGLPIVRLTAELLHGYCGIYDDPTIQLALPTIVSSGSTTHYNHTNTSNHSIPSDADPEASKHRSSVVASSSGVPPVPPRPLKVTRFFFEIPYVKGPGVAFPSVPLTTATTRSRTDTVPSVISGSPERNITITTTLSTTDGAGRGMVTKESFPVVPPVPLPSSLPSLELVPPAVISSTTEPIEEELHPELSVVESSPTAVLTYLREPVMTPTSSRSVAKSYFSSPLAPTTPQMSVPTLPSRRAEPGALYEEMIHETISPSVMLPPSPFSQPPLPPSTIVPPPPRPTTPLPLISASTLPPVPLQNLRILVVDDEEVVRRVSSRLLTKLGARVTTLTDGDEVLDAIIQADTNDEGYDAVLLDVIMRRVNGDIAVQQIRRAGFLSLPVFAASGNVSIEDAEKYIEHGFTAVLSKPFTKDTVLALFVKYHVIRIPSIATTTTGTTITVPSDEASTKSRTTKDD